LLWHGSCTFGARFIKLTRVRAARAAAVCGANC
jgi:hypothetical protein